MLHWFNNTMRCMQLLRREEREGEREREKERRRERERVGEGEGERGRYSYLEGSKWLIIQFCTAVPNSGKSLHTHLVEEDKEDKRRKEGRRGKRERKRIVRGDM